MGRATEALAYCNLDPKKLDKKWIKHNMTSQSVTIGLKERRKEYLKRKKKKQHESIFSNNRNIKCT